MNKYTVNDAIVDLELVESTGGFVLKITRLSCKTGYVTVNGISGKITNALTISGSKTITLNSFSELEEYEFTDTPVNFNIIEDEDKNQENTSYNWTGSVLKWNAEVVDDFQPTIN